MTKTTSNKNPIVELLLCIFLGTFGAHRFYTRKFGTAILYLLTFGLFYIGWVVDIILIIIRLTKRKEDAPTPVVEAPIVSVIESREAVADASPSSDAEPVHEEETTPSIPVVPEIVSNSDTAAYTDRTYKVAGTTHYEDHILSLAIENTNYDMTKKEIIDASMTDEKIWKYEFYPSKVGLVPEPENPYDKNAIKVLVDGEHVGYIKAGSCVHLLKAIDEDRVLGITCTISGGPCKIVTEEYDFEKDKDIYTLDHDERNYSVTLVIREAKPTT